MNVVIHGEGELSIRRKRNLQQNSREGSRRARRASLQLKDRQEALDFESAPTMVVHLKLVHPCACIRTSLKATSETTPCGVSNRGYNGSDEWETPGTSGGHRG